MRPSLDTYREAMLYDSPFDAELHRIRLNLVAKWWPTHGPTDAVTSFSGNGDGPAHPQPETQATEDSA